jgi:3'-phosphoadenosine 5'-phosphosulfate (PAPS) 3'-phosphatase|tara:strand:+ start:23 stop:526 length:504 start_codon:yes stop_codon:yes gene_type:complete
MLSSLLTDLDLGRHSWVRTVSMDTGYAAEMQTATSLALRCGAAMAAVSASSLARTATLKDGEEGGIDPVTQTDVNNEQLVASALRRQFPRHAIVGEESTAVLGHSNPNPNPSPNPDPSPSPSPSSSPNQALGRGVPRIDPATPTWVVDPIDGTQNFVHALPLSCVSI